MGISPNSGIGGGGIGGAGIGSGGISASVSASFSPSSLFSAGEDGDYWDATVSGSLTESGTGDPIQEDDEIGTFDGQLGRYEINDKGATPFYWRNNNIENTSSPGYIFGTNQFSLSAADSSFSAFCSFSIKAPPNVSAVDIMWINQQGGGMHYGGVTFEANTGRLVYAPTDNAADNIVSQSVVADRESHTAGIVYDAPNDTYHLYIDGILEGSTVNPVGTKYDVNGFYVGLGDDPDRNAEERYVWKFIFVGSNVASSVSDIDAWLLEGALVSGTTVITEDVAVSLDEDTTTTDSFSGRQIHGDPITYAVQTGPADGEVANNGDGTFEYTPDPNYNGSDSFSYSATDGTYASVSNVNITINSIVEDPSFKDTFTETTADTPLSMHTPNVDASGNGWTVGAESSATVREAADVVEVTGVTNRGLAFAEAGADVYLARVTCPSSGENIFACLRTVDEDNYIAVQWLSGGTFRAVKFEDGNFSVLTGAPTQTRAADDVIWWYDDGTTIRAGRLNGSSWQQLLNFNEAAFSGVAKAGIGTANGASTTYDNFAILPNESDQSNLGTIIF
ncbi:Ig-like domain-containing protein [Alcanivorax sp.]|uniref:Ig-like domain-containing protein n=1 Tax=Alcanivorax sp. TaxID=1872427 RepID=UPI0019AAD5E9|nr:Ig-like domain-containing protein [Alcanivorax sp.]MBD3643533.1 cadherin-like domain-containing protein [Alcanivorax sp.]